MREVDIMYQEWFKKYEEMINKSENKNDNKKKQSK